MMIVLLCTALLLSALYAFQGKLIYFPTRMSRGDFERTVRAAGGDRASILAPFDAVVVEPPADVASVGTVIFFHGNAGLGIDRAYLLPAFTRRRLRLVLAEYPGYGARGGAPTERRLVADAQALYAQIARTYPNAPIMLAGESLGSAVAVQVATHSAAPVASRVVLLVPFLSLVETAARVYPFLPVRYLVRDRFDSRAQLPLYGGTVAILVAGRDEVVGPAQGRELARVPRALGATIYVELPEAGHNDWPTLITDEEWTELLGGPPVPGA